MAFITNPMDTRELLERLTEIKGNQSSSVVQRLYLSLALGRLQLESWVGMASSTTLRHPEGTTGNREEGTGRREVVRAVCGLSSSGPGQLTNLMNPPLERVG